MALASEAHICWPQDVNVCLKTASDMCRACGCHYHSKEFGDNGLISEDSPQHLHCKIADFFCKRNPILVDWRSEGPDTNGHEYTVTESGHAQTTCHEDSYDMMLLYILTGNLNAGAPDTVGTTGRWDLSPNTVNSVPRDATLEIDVRDIDGPRRDKVVAAITAAAAAIAKRRNVRHEVAMVNQDDPATCGSEVSCLYGQIACATAPLSLLA